MSKPRFFTPDDIALVIAACDELLAEMKPELREKMDRASFVTGYLNGLASSRERIRKTARRVRRKGNSIS